MRPQPSCVIDTSVWTSACVTPVSTQFCGTCHNVHRPDTCLCCVTDGVNYVTVFPSPWAVDIFFQCYHSCEKFHFAGTSMLLALVFCMRVWLLFVLVPGCCWA